MGVADAFRMALPIAAAKLEEDGFGAGLKPEERLRQALAQALREQSQIAEVLTTPEWRPEMRFWPATEGRLGGFDVSFRDVASEAWSGVVETKWKKGGVDALDEVLWDAFKLAHAVETIDGVCDAFLVYAALATAWAKPPRYADLFTDGMSDSAGLIAKHPDVWSWLLRTSSAARPKMLPPRLASALIAEATSTIGGEQWLIRCARVRPIGEPWIGVDESGQPQVHSGGLTLPWPTPEPGPWMEPDPGTEPAPPTSKRELSDDELTAADVPPAEADWSVINRFAHSTKDHSRSGGNENLAALANTVSLYFDRLAELPPLELPALRACLLFEARRYHHFGHAPDSESSAYIRALIEAIRERATS